MSMDLDIGGAGWNPQLQRDPESPALPGTESIGGSGESALRNGTLGAFKSLSFIEFRKVSGFISTQFEH